MADIRARRWSEGMVSVRGFVFYTLQHLGIIELIWLAPYA